MTTTEQAIVDAIGFLMDIRGSIVPVISGDEYIRMNEVLTQLADETKKFKDDGAPWGGTYTPHKP